MNLKILLTRLLLLVLNLNLEWLNLNTHPLFLIPHLSCILLSLLNKIFKVFLVLDECLSFFSVYFDDHFILSNLCLQLDLDCFLGLLLLHAFLNKVKQLIFVSLDLSLLFLHLIDLISKLLLHLLSLKSLVGQLNLEPLLHVFLFVSLKLLELVERINEVLVVWAKLLCLALCCQHLNETINIWINWDASSGCTFEGKTELSKFNFNTFS